MEHALEMSISRQHKDRIFKAFIIISKVFDLKNFDLIALLLISASITLSMSSYSINILTLCLFIGLIIYLYVNLNHYLYSLVNSSRFNFTAYH